jgi:hypothetical protein
MDNTTRTSFRRAAFYSQLKSTVGNIFVKATALRINLDIDDSPIPSREHTHPSHSQTSLLSTPLSLGTPFPRPT